MSLTPQPGDYVRVYGGLGSPNDYSDEAMEEVDLSALKWGERPANTVWRITDAAKRIMDDSEAPVFQYDPAGGTDWEALTPTEIWYGAGYIITADLGASAVVRCHSGHYLTPSEFFGCATKKFTDKVAMQEITAYGDTAIQRAPTLEDWDGSIEAFVAKRQAELLTSGGAANSHILLRHTAGGVDGNDLTLTITDTDQNALSITVNGDDITVDLKTSGGNPVSTAREVVAAINANAACRAMKVRAYIPPGETGAGVVAAAVQASFAGGLDKIAYEDLRGERLAFRFYTDFDNGEMCVGFGFVSDIDWIGGPADFLKAGLTIQGHRYRLHHVRESYA